MKYVVIAKSRRNYVSDEGKSKLSDMLDTRDKMRAARENGSLEGVYALVAGGSIWVVNADSNEALARTLRKYRLSDAADVEVIPVIDAFSVLDERIEQLKAAGQHVNGSPHVPDANLQLR